ncbi:hypothetical protein ACN4EE_06200 [Geminocystis sp. CENA526]|uniref:hypothetical protein n=1 Tax=Geminocystis sp. CENA526 TaxID=1355871 RepID=UPI003D6EB956
MSLSLLSDFAKAQFICNDPSLGTDIREVINSEETRTGSNVVIGTNCNNANFYEHQDRQKEKDVDIQELLWERHLQKIEDSFSGGTTFQERTNHNFHKCHLLGTDPRLCNHAE